jgi:hypothetical protein
MIIIKSSNKRLFTIKTVSLFVMNKKPTKALIIQCIDTQYSATCFSTLKCHHQGVKHDPAEIDAQCCGKQRWMEAVYCNRRHDGRDITERSITFYTLRSEIRRALRLRYVDLVVSIEVAVEVCCCFTVLSC